MYNSITILTGHTLAVTSVDWKEIGQQSLIATCADDRVSIQHIATCVCYVHCNDTL